MMPLRSAPILSLLTVLVLLSCIACADTEPKRPSILDSMDQQKLVQQTSNRTIRTTLEEKEEVSFSVVYTGDLDVILFSSTSHLRALIETYELQLSDPFEIDEHMKGIILHSYDELSDPIEIAKEISQCEEVLMVEAKNLPETTDSAL